MIRSGTASVRTRYNPIALMKTRMSQSSRLSWARTTGATPAPARVTRDSAMKCATGIDAEMRPRQRDELAMALGDVVATDEGHGQLGAQAHVAQLGCDELGSEQGAQEHNGLDPGLDDVLAVALH